MCNDKFIKSTPVSNYEVLTDTGYEDIKFLHKTKKYKLYKLKTETKQLDCADTHIVFDEDYNEIYVKDLQVGDYIITDGCKEKVIEIIITDDYKNMYDLELNNSKNKRYYTNGILSHNTTSYSIFALWMCCFQEDKKILIVANKEKTALEFINRIKLAFENLPKWLKPGVEEGGWNKSKITFANGSSIEGCSTSADSARGFSGSCLILDEIAFVPNNIQTALWSSVYPTISSSKKTKCMLISTPNGASGIFFDIYTKATLGTSKLGFKPFRIDW